MKTLKQLLENREYYYYRTATKGYGEEPFIKPKDISKIVEEWLKQKHDEFADQYVSSDGNVYLKHAYRTIEELLSELREDSNKEKVEK